MDTPATMSDFIALRDLETEHHENTSLKAIAWVIGVVIVLAIIAFFLRGHYDGRANDYRHESNYRCEHGEHRGRLAFVEKQIEKLDERVDYNHGKLEKLYGEFGCYSKYTTHEVEEIENRVYPSGYIGWELPFRGDRREGRECERREGNCGKKFARRDTYTPATQEVVVTEDCNCNCC